MVQGECMPGRSGSVILLGLMGLLGLAAGCAVAPSGGPAAKPVVLQWDAVGRRENGEPLQLSELSHYQVEQRECGGTEVRLTEVAADATRLEIPAAQLGGSCTEFRVRAVDVGGVASTWSTPVRAMRQ